MRSTSRCSEYVLLSNASEVRVRANGERGRVNISSKHYNMTCSSAVRIDAVFR